MTELILVAAWLVSAVISCATGAAVCGLIGFAVGTWIGWMQRMEEAEREERIRQRTIQEMRIDAARSIITQLHKEVIA